MKKILSTILLLAMLLSLVACSDFNGKSGEEVNDENADYLGEDEKSFGADLNELHAYDGHFDSKQTNLEISCVYGDMDCYTLENGVLKFSNITQDCIYAISGRLYGNIIIDISDEHSFELEMRGVSIISDGVAPIVANGGRKISITAKKGYDNYIYDEREAVTADSTDHSSAVYANADLTVGGKGGLFVISNNNNGIHTNNDLEVKNLELLVSSARNPLRGNDSVTLSYAIVSAIATKGDGIKTTDSDISTKEKQRGDITFQGGTYNIYSAMDAIFASHDVIINDTNTVINVYTDKYSNYSNSSTSFSESEYFIRYINQKYKYSVKYSNDNGEVAWIDAAFYSIENLSDGDYYYFSFPKFPQYNKMKIFIYDDSMKTCQEDSYLACTDNFMTSNMYDTFLLSVENNKLTYHWTTYEESITPVENDRIHTLTESETEKVDESLIKENKEIDEGNTDRGLYSSKGIKADNDITINGGTITVKSYDDSIHSKFGEKLDNEKRSTGKITINDGNITLYSNDDGIGAGGELEINGGNIYVCHSYEGIEGSKVTVSGGNLMVHSLDDGINSTNMSGDGIVFNGGTINVVAGGDGIDSNSKDKYKGAIFNGGDVVILSTSGGNAAIDTERGYTYKGGRVVAIMPQFGFVEEMIECENFKKIGKEDRISISADSILEISENGKRIVDIMVPTNIEAAVVFLGNSNVDMDINKNYGKKIDNLSTWN